MRAGCTEAAFPNQVRSRKPAGDIKKIRPSSKSPAPPVPIRPRIFHQAFGRSPRGGGCDRLAQPRLVAAAEDEFGNKIRRPPRGLGQRHADPEKSLCVQKLFLSAGVRNRIHPQRRVSPRVQAPADLRCTRSSKDDCAEQLSAPPPGHRPAGRFSCQSRASRANGNAAGRNHFRFFAALLNPPTGVG